MWWQIPIGAVVLIAVVYAFITLVRSQTRSLSSKSDRTAADLYDSHADSPRKQRRYAQERGGEWKDK